MKAAEELPKHLNYNELLSRYELTVPIVLWSFSWWRRAYIRDRNTLPVTVYCLPDDCSVQSLDCVFVCSYWWITWWSPKQLTLPSLYWKCSAIYFVCYDDTVCTYMVTLCLLYGDNVHTYVCGDAVSSMWWHCTYVYGDAVSSNGNNVRMCMVILWHPCGDTVTSMWWRCFVWQMVTSRSWWMRWTVVRCCMLWSRWRTPTLSSSRMSG